MSQTDGDALESIRESPRTLLSLTMSGFGLVLLLIGVIGGTTPVLKTALGLNQAGAWLISGLFSGLALPIVVIGVFVVLPATKTQRLGAAIGLLLCLIGMGVFAVSFPHAWFGDTPDRSLLTTLTYSVGLLVTLFYLFLAVANFHPPSGARRNQQQSGRRYQTMRSSEPNTAKELIVGSIMRALGKGSTDESETDDVVDDIDYDSIQDALEELLGDSLAEEPERAEREDADLKLVREREIKHSQFTASFPQYVSIVEQDDTTYWVDVDAEVYALVTSV